MHLRRPVRRLLLALILYRALSVVAGILLCDGSLYPARRPLSAANESQARDIVQAHHATLREISLGTPDHLTLRAWLLVPHHPNASAVILLHGLRDNRTGMLDYAHLLLDHHNAVLMPDAIATSSREFEKRLVDWYEDHTVALKP